MHSRSDGKELNMFFKKWSKYVEELMGFGEDLREAIKGLNVLVIKKKRSEE